MKPLFIVFEGIDGSGKSTQADILFKKITSLGTSAVRLSEPSPGPYGQEIRRLMKNSSMPDAGAMLDLFIKDREEDVKLNINPALEAGKTVVLDRYYFSNAAYQGAMGLNWKNIIEANVSKKFPEPDRVYLIDISLKTALQRIEARRSGPSEIFEREKFLERVKENYHEMKDKSFLVIDGEQTIKTVSEIIFKDYTSLSALS